MVQEVEGGVLVEAPSEDTRLPPGQPRPDLPSGFLPASPPVYPGVSPPASSGDTLSEASVIVFIISAALVSLFIALGLIAACVFIYWFKQRNARDERPGQATEMQPTGTMHVHNASYQPKVRYLNHSGLRRGQMAEPRLHKAHVPRVGITDMGTARVVLLTSEHPPCR